MFEFVPTEKILPTIKNISLSLCSSFSFAQAMKVKERNCY